jgi:hypothetical protein
LCAQGVSQCGVIEEMLFPCVGDVGRTDSRWEKMCGFLSVRLPNAPQNFKPNESTHAVAKKRVGAVEQRADCMKDAIGKLIHIVDQCFAEATFSPGKLDCTYLHVAWESFRPAAVQRCRTACRWQTK